MPEFNLILSSKWEKSSFKTMMPAENYRIKTLLCVLGGCKIQKIRNNKIEPLTKNFTTIPLSNSDIPKIESIQKLFPICSKKKLSQFFNNNYSKNLKLHKKIYNELITALGYFGIDQPIPSFVSIYRLIEQLALCVPFVAMIDKGDFIITFEQINRIIKSQTKSDLDFLKKYSEEKLDSNVREIEINLDFQFCKTPDLNVDIVKDILKANQCILLTNDSVRIKMKYIPHLIIGFRNQFFHYLFHEKNFDYDVIPYPEEFLEVCNPYFLNYLTQLVLILLKSEFELWG